MLYATLQTGNKEYKGRLSAHRSVELEKALGKSPLKVFTELNNDELPSMSDLMTILHYSLVDLEHSINEYEVFDEYCENGGDIGSLIEYILEVFKVSGLIPKNPEKEAEKKSKRKN